MIRQADLAYIASERERAAELLKSAAAQKYAADVAKLQQAIEKANAAWQRSDGFRQHSEKIAGLLARIEALPKPGVLEESTTAAANADKLLGTVKKAYKKDPSVEPGPLKLHVVVSGSTQWEKVHDALAAIPAVAKALLDKAAVAVLGQARARDVSAPFVTQTISQFEVVPDPDWKPKARKK